MKKSVARDSLDKAIAEGEILLSLDIIEELYGVLSRPAFDRYIDEEDRLRFLSLLIKEATLVEISEQIQECRDPKDDKFLELAVNGNATLIVSGDKDLQVLNPFRNIPIFSTPPRVSRRRVVIHPSSFLIHPYDLPTPSRLPLPFQQ
ncbi:MAG: putative toxin-antitoxin system toxin component, PIN family [Chloroflexi bacterium]|nr:putative toxin-antitoxin system toxin component, PIN family [Chloroflexota bacterium]